MSSRTAPIESALLSTQFACKLVPVHRTRELAAVYRAGQAWHVEPSVGSPETKMQCSSAWRRTLSGLAIFVVLTNAACRVDSGRDRNEHTTVTVLASPNWLHPAWGMDAMRLVFLPLVAPDTSGELRGSLAESWDHSPDYREWTVRLRPDVYWHDRVPVTTDDVQFTAGFWEHPDVVYTGRKTVSRLQSLDEHTFSFVAPRPGPDVLQDWFVLPRHLLERLDPRRLSEWEFWRAPVGNGPYRYVRHTPEVMVELEANPDFFAGPPAIKRVILKAGGDLFAEVLSGNVDIAYPEPHELSRLGSEEWLRVYYSLNTLSTLALYWNHRHELFRDPVVRRALTHAINRRELLRVLDYPAETPIVDGPFTRRQYDRGELPDPIAHDPQRASDLLAAAGWRDADGDGVREREGRAFAFDAFVHPAYLTAAVYVQEQLRRVGVRMEIPPFDGSVVRQRVSDGRFEAAFLALWSRREGNLGLEQMFGAEALVGYDNPEVVSLLGAELLTGDPDAQDALFGRLSEIFRQDVPVTILTPGITYVVAHERIGGLRNPLRGDPLGYLERLWIEDSR